jgi:hypothetical protein
LLNSLPKTHIISVSRKANGVFSNTLFSWGDSGTQRIRLANINQVEKRQPKTESALPIPLWEKGFVDEKRCAPVQAAHLFCDGLCVSDLEVPFTLLRLVNSRFRVHVSLQTKAASYAGKRQLHECL